MLNLDYKFFMLQLDLIDQAGTNFGRHALTRKIRGGRFPRMMSIKELDKLATALDEASIGIRDAILKYRNPKTSIGKR